MAIGHQYLLYSKLYVHLDVKYHVHIDVLISRPNFYFPHLIRCNTVKFLKLYMYVSHFFCNFPGPKFSPQLPVNFICLLYCIGDLYPKLLCFTPILGFYSVNNPILTAKILLNPPAEGRFITCFIYHGIFIQFNYFGLFNFLSWSPIN